MKNRRLQWASLAIIVALAATLRLYDLGNNPAGFYCDEAGLGYNAFTIANAGTDENGKPYPLFFWSFYVSYKNPAFIYAAALPVRLLGTTEFAVRLTSALFGIGTVVGMFFLGRTLMGPGLGVLAALFLAIAPWHIHFSRIAFELVAFPFFFVWGLHFFIGFLQGRRTLPAAMFCFALCFYAYAIANLFVPLFVVGATLLFLPSFFRRWGQSALALIVLAATVAPVATFYYERLGTSGSQYFRTTTHLQPGEPLAASVQRTWNHYLHFFSPEFLFERGDPMVRHSVPGFGELYPFLAPLIILGVGLALVSRERQSKLLLWWLLLYPLGASLMTEIPSATRGFIGVPAFCLLAAIGALAVLRFLGRIGRRPAVATTLQGIAVAIGLFFLLPQVRDYLRAYFIEYPKQSAQGYGGFQFGYRDSIRYMESRREDYDLLMLTAVEVNQPQIFPQFYRGVAPGRHHGYLIVDPSEFRRYSTEQRILAQLRPSDLHLFSDYEIHREIVAPNGETEFVVAELRERKSFLTHWLVLGLFENDDGMGIHRDHIDVRNLNRDGYPGGAFGPVYWRSISPQMIVVDLNRFFARADPRHPGNPENVCAYAALTVESDMARDGFIEIVGSPDLAHIWLNGSRVTEEPVLLRNEIHREPIALRAGDNLLIVKSCESVGGWDFRARLTDADGRDMPGIRTLPELRRTSFDTDADTSSPSDPTGSTLRGADHDALEAQDAAPLLAGFDLTTATLLAVEKREGGSLWFSETSHFRVPNVGAAISPTGSIAFWIEPAWDGFEDSDRAFVQIRAEHRWEGRIKIFKNGPFLRFLFIDAEGVESGVGLLIDSWRASERRYIVATWSESELSLFVDGVLVGTDPFSGLASMPPTTPLLLGSDFPGGIRPANAAIGAFELVDRALTEDEVQARMVQ